MAYIAQEIEDGYQAREHTLAVWVDMEKAFDTVWREALKLKLLRMGVTGRMFEWLAQYLENRTARVQVEGKLSRKRTLEQGVPQGGVLSPTLCLVFVNDIAPCMPIEVRKAMYADDLALWMRHKSIAVARKLMQTSLDQIGSWSKQWFLTINAAKTTYSIFTNAIKAQKATLKINDCTLPAEPNPTYLGVTFDRRLTWCAQIDMVTKKARERTCMMRKLAGSSWGASGKVLSRLYTGRVRPVLEYGIAAWSAASTTQFGKVEQNRKHRGCKVVTSRHSARHK